MAANSAQAPASRENPYSFWLLKKKTKDKRKGRLGMFPVASIFVCFAIGAPIMLVGLPLGALWIVHESGCCTGGSVANVLTFWGSVLAGMLTLFGMLVTAVFVISAFRIDKSAKAEAGVAAAEYAGNFFVEYKAAILREIDKRMEQATEYFVVAKTKTQTAKKDAIVAIHTAKAVAESASKTAVRTIGKAVGDVDERKTAAIKRIDEHVAEVERAAAEAKARIQAQPDDSPPGDSRG